MHGQAVLQAVHAAGVLRHVAADGAGDLRGRVRRVIEVEGRRRLGNRQVAHAGLDAGEAPGGADFEDAVEARHHQQDALFQRQGAAGETCAGASGHYWNPEFMAGLQELLDLLDALRQHHQHGRGAVGGEAVAFVGLEVFLAVEDVQVRQALAQLGQQRGLVDFRQRAVDALVVEDVHGRLGLVVMAPAVAGHS
ncbi:hypothetical protein D3C80_896400 [compost metagenome]